MFTSGSGSGGGHLDASMSRHERAAQDPSRGLLLLLPARARGGAASGKETEGALEDEEEAARAADEAMDNDCYDDTRAEMLGAGHNLVTTYLLI
jgi:hypothetical protein